MTDISNKQTHHKCVFEQQASVSGFSTSVEFV